jgi:hypothetical protein
VFICTHFALRMLLAITNIPTVAMFLNCCKDKGKVIAGLN